MRAVVRSRKFRLNVPAGKIAADRKARIGRYVRIDRQSRADDGPVIFQEEAVARVARGNHACAHPRSQ